MTTLYRVLIVLLTWMASRLAFATTMGATDSTGQVVQVIKEVGVPVSMLIWFAWRDRAQMKEVIEKLGAIVLELRDLRNSSDRVTEEVTGRHSTKGAKP